MNLYKNAKNVTLSLTVRSMVELLCIGINNVLYVFFCVLIPIRLP